jgi:hypothetical protein
VRRARRANALSGSDDLESILEAGCWSGGGEDSSWTRLAKQKSISVSFSFHDGELQRCAVH